MPACPDPGSIGQYIQSDYEKMLSKEPPTTAYN